MNTKTTISISDARKKIFKIAKEVQKADKHYTLTEKGSPKAVVVSAEQFESMMETLESIKDFPNLEKDIRTAKEDFRFGRVNTLEKILAKEGFILTTRK